MPQSARIRRFIPALGLLILAGCSAVIVPPEPVHHPVSVFVLDHGRHASLVLPLEEEHPGSVRYSYGDWDYYALGRTGLASGLRALLMPTPAALGRQALGRAPAPAEMQQWLLVEIEAVHEIRVEAAASRRLRAELEALFAASDNAAHYRADYDVHFVPHPEPYTLWNNSNRMIVRWLEALGCEMRGRPVLSDWRVAR